MADPSDQAFDPNTFFQQWMQSMAGTWTGMLAPPRRPSGEGDASAGEGPEAGLGEKPGDPSLEAALRFAKTTAAAFSDPGKWSEMFSGVNAMPHVFLSMMQPMVENMAGMHRKWLEKATSFGKLPDDFDLGHLEQESLAIFDRTFDAEFKKLLNIPQLGPARESQEKLNRYFEHFNRLQSALAGFLRQLYGPLKGAYEAFQGRLADMMEAGELPDNAKSYYQLWLKTLEGFYMTKLRSPEFLEALSETLGAAAHYTQSKKDLQNDLMRRFSLPSHADVNALYKDLYDVKKRLKAIEERIKKK